MKSILGFSKYFVDENGHITNLNGDTIKPRKIKGGYLRVTLYDDEMTIRGKLVHRLVLENYNPIDGMNLLDVNHKDGDKTNNSISNLEWCTRSENVKHAFNTGLKIAKGSKNNCSKLKEKDIPEIRKMLSTGISCATIGTIFNVSRGTINSIRVNKTWKHC